MKPKQSFSTRGGSSAKRQRHAKSRRPRPLRTLHFTVGLFAALAPLVGERAAAITWIGGNVDWVDGTGTANWSPADEPDPDDAVVFNTANAVNLGSNNSILSLALSGGISLNTNDFDLTINGLLQLQGAGTDVTIAGTASSVSADFATINTDGRIFLDGGALRIADETAAGLLDINAGGTLSGQGSIYLDDALAAATVLLSNDGTLSAAAPGLVIGMPAAGTLTIPAGNSFARVDLDGTSGAGVVTVGRNQLFDINVALNDAFSGTLNLSHRSTFDVSTAWSIDSVATINVDNGAITVGFPIAAATSFIAGATFTQTGGTITVVDGDGTLQFNAPFAQSGGDLVNNGLVVFNANAAIGAGANFTMPTATSSLTVNAGMEVNIDQANFNADGGGFSTNEITIGSGGILDLDLGVGADTGLYCTTLLNGGELDVTTATDAWSLSGPLTVGASTGTSQINGEAVTINTTATIGAGSTLSVNAASTLSSTASFAVAAGATLDFFSAPTFNGASFTGAGILRVGGSSQVTADTTIGVATFDWDRDTGGHTHTIAEGILFTVNSPTFDSDGDMIDSITLRGNGSTLTMNGPTSWTMNATLTTNPLALGSAFVGGTSRMVLASGGILNANGNTTINAPATLGASSTTNVAAAATLILGSSGTIFDGGAVNGAGTLRVGSNSSVTGNSTIAVNTFDWDGLGVGSTQTIDDGASFTITSPVFDADGDMDDPLNMGGGGASLSVSGPLSWTMVNTLNANAADSGLATIGGTSRLILSTATGILNARGDTSISAPITFGADSATNISAPAVLTLNNSAIFDGGAISGAGTLVIDKSSVTTANTTIAANTLDWDGGTLGSLHTIGNGVIFTIDSPVISDPMDDAVTLGGSGATLVVNGPTSWEMAATLTTNVPVVGTATIGGTSRMILTSAEGLFNVNGNTTVAAPITFGSGSTTTVAAPAVLTVNGAAIYDGGSITGAGYYAPPSTNTVTATSGISVADFNFDRGNWTLNAGGSLTVVVSDYDPDSAAGSKAFDGTLTITDAALKVTSAEPTFVMDGLMNCLSTFTHAAWASSSDPLDIGNDAGSLDAALNILGTSNTQIATTIDFKSDADVFIDADATLQLLGTASFNSVNGANNAEFTGGGRLQANREVNFYETTTINMTGGAIDLDGADAVGDIINVLAPVIIKVATMDSFGKVNGGGGTNILAIDNSGGTGTLTVNLDSPTGEWTLNGPGELRLFNDPTPATLLAGSDVNLNGTVQVAGDVRTDARVDIGGTVNILTLGEPFRLAGGNLTDTNTLVGGTINGPGLLGADTNSSLIGYGTINANVDFDGNADLLADNGTLTVNSSLLDARFVGTNDTDGVLNVVNAWNSTTVAGVSLKGGELKGGILTNDGTGGITGSGLISSRVINNTAITATTSAAPLILQTAANDNDWDGDNVPETGRLQANAGTLELRSSGGGFGFNSAVTAINGGTVFANGFELAMMASSALSLTTGTFKQSNGITTNLNGTITVGAGTSRLLGATTGGFRFNASSATTLTGNLLLDCPTSIIQTGATFGGAGTLVNLPSRRLAPDNNANLNVLVENAGTLAPGGTGIARNDFRDFIQGASGVLEVNLNGTTLGTFDRVQVNGSAQLAGTLQLTLGGGYVPALNDTITILSTTGAVAGLFSPLVQPAGMPAGLAFEVNYLPNSVQLKVVSATPFDVWINTFGIANPADRTKSANPDGDSLNNLGEFGTDGNPTSGANSGKIVGKVAPVGGVNAMTLTLPVRNGTVLDPADPAGGELGLKQTADGLFYKIQASDALGTWALTVSEVTAPDATAIQLGLPALNPGWTYRTFRSPGPVAGDPAEFMRAVISD